MIPAIDYPHSGTLNTILDHFFFGTFGALWSLHLNFPWKVAMDTFVALEKCYKMALIKLQSHWIPDFLPKCPVSFCKHEQLDYSFINYYNNTISEDADVANGIPVPVITIGENGKGNGNSFFQFFDMNNSLIYIQERKLWLHLKYKQPLVNL